MIRDLFRIFLSVRWPNLVITVITISISYFFLIVPAFTEAGIETRLKLSHFIIANIAMIFVMAGGYIINDWMDAESDAANKKGGAIPFIPRRTIMISYAMANIMAFLLALWICIDINDFQLLSIPLIVIALLLLYSTTLKSTPLLGNFTIAFLSGAIPLLPLTFDYGFSAFLMDINTTAIYFLSFLAFLISLIRELIKDMEDVAGDQSQNQITFPVLMGMEASRWTAFVFFLFFILLLSLMLYFLIRTKIYSASFLFIFILLPILFLSFKLIKSESSKDYHSISTGLKWIMVSGLIFAIVYYFS